MAEDPVRASAEWQRRFIRGVSNGVRDVAHAIESGGNAIIRGEDSISVAITVGPGVTQRVSSTKKGRGAFDEGTLHNSSELRPPEGAARMGNRVWVEVAWTAKHSVYVHFGTPPHKPPLGPLYEWVKRNVMFHRKSRRAVFKPRDTEGLVKSDTEALNLAFAIQGKIAKEGTPAFPWGTSAVLKVGKRASRIIKQAVEESMRNP